MVDFLRWHSSRSFWRRSPTGCPASSSGCHSWPSPAWSSLPLTMKILPRSGWRPCTGRSGWASPRLV